MVYIIGVLGILVFMEGRRGIVSSTYRWRNTPAKVGYYLANLCCPSVGHLRYRRHLRWELLFSRCPNAVVVKLFGD